MKSVEVEVRNPQGLHARPAALFVRGAAKYRSRITIENLATGKPPADAKALVKVLAAGIRRGHMVRIAAEGEDEEQAADGLKALIEGGLGERIEATPATAPAPPRPAAEPLAPPAPALAGALRGTPGAQGIAIGPVWRYVPASASALDGPSPTRTIGIRAAAAEAARQLETLATRVREAGHDEEAAIFEAQAVMAADEELLSDADARGGDPVAAVRAAAADGAAQLAALPDELLAARAADVRDVGERIVRILAGATIELPSEPSIAVAEDLPPSVTAEVPAGLLLGIALEAGSPTAHAVILARGLGIPAVVGVPRLLAVTSAAHELGVDGATGEVAVDPAPEQLAELRKRAASLEARREAARTLRGKRGATADGEHVALLANIGTPDDAQRAIEVGVEGVGLFRTEFLYMRRQTPPTEAEQTAAYRRVLEAFGPERPVVIRLADVGGDKAIPYLHLPPEANPFLGVRAIRLAYDAAGSRDLLLTQLRAIWRAGALAGVTPHVMAPMVATAADVDLLLELRETARRSLADAGEPVAERIVTGIMVEIPAAALLAAELAKLVDFFSIGTNDLTQYALAADRGNATLGGLQDALQPAVLRLIASVVRGADAARIPVAVCGELAGDPAGALVLVGLGVDELSADAGSIDGVRAALAGVTRAELDELAGRALAATDARTVRAMTRRLLARGEMA